MKIRFALLAALVSLGLAMPALAQESTTVTGTVVSAGDDSIVIRTEDGEQRTFVIDTQTSLPSEELAPGAQVSIRFTQPDPSTFQATRVTVQEERAAAGALGDDDELPATASPFPLLALGGLIALAGGALVRLTSRVS